MVSTTPTKSVSHYLWLDNGQVHHDSIFLLSLFVNLYVILKKFTEFLTHSVVCYKTVTNKKFDDYVDAKIGLINISDFEYSVQKDGLDCHRNESTSESCNNGWMILSEFAFPGEWVMTRAGFHIWATVYVSWYIDSSEDISYIADYYDNVVLLLARPVFFLKNTITIKEDSDGTIENPYIINE